MSFHEVRFPDEISYGSHGGPGYMTTILQLDSGSEVRIGRWATPLRTFNIAYGVKSRESMVALQTFFIARQGALFGFRFKDYKDYSTDPNGFDTTNFNDVALPASVGSTATVQLTKSYVSGGVTQVRTITKPVAGTIRVGKNGSEMFSGWSVDTTTGIVTFSPPLSNGDVPTWGGEFDVPVRFGADSDILLDISIDDYANFSAQSVELVELKDGLVAPEPFNPGGSGEDAITADLSIGFGQGRIRLVRPLGSGLSVRLPNPSLINPQTGGSFFYVWNDSPTFSLTLRDNIGTSLATIGVGQCVEAFISKDGGGTAYWYAA